MGKGVRYGWIAPVTALLVCLGAFIALPAAAAETGTVHNTAGAGLRMTLSTRWLDGPGYRPVEITFSPTGTVNADRTLTVEVLVFQGGTNFSLRAARDVKIPAGSGPVTAVLAVPHNWSWSSYAVNVVEDGALIRGLSVPQTPFMYYPQNAVVETLPNILFVGPGPVDTRQLAAGLPIDQYLQNQPYVAFTPSGAPSAVAIGPGGMATSAVPALPDLPTAMFRTPGQLPVRWIEYTNLDVVCLKLDDLKALASQRPEAFRAVVEWTAAGGNLWVCGAGDGFARLGQIETLLGLTPGEADEQSPPLARAWREPDKRLYGQPLSGVSGTGPTTYYGPRYGPMAMPPPAIVDEVRATPVPDPGALPLPKAPEKSPFLLRDFQTGLVVVFAEPDPFPGTSQDWAWVFNAMGADRRQWHERHGLSLVRENREFWSFLIPGVGLVPAIEFGVLITIFVVAIGPLNYLLLKRWKRLHLLVVSIPTSAAAVTLALFVYAVLADGLGTRVRARSVTRLDQRNGRAASWTRLSYYAGIKPSGGLTFAEDTAVYPLEPYPALAFSGERGSSRELIWGQDGQWLASGWLPARTPTQYLTVRSRATTAGLDIGPPDAKAASVSVTNRLGTGIVQLLVRAEDGVYYGLEDLPDGQTATAPKVDPFAAGRSLHAAYTSAMPQFPTGMDRDYYDMGRPRRYWYRGYYDPGLSPPTPQTSRLERLLAEAAMPNSVGGGAGMARRNYVAVVRESPEAALGTPAAREEASYHVVLGEY